ncbi:MAG: hypothetical protein IKF93_06905 [Lachnospiraceae bacterium]|nr:hypothetical protein [Lachnospiraceae bacterium]
MLPRWFSSLLIWDKILIIVFTLFAAFLITAMIIISAPERRRKLERLLTKWVIRLEEFNAAMRDDEAFDPEWMDAKKWRQTRP